MSSQTSGYHVGYETTKAYQAQMRELRAQDRAAHQVRAAQPDGPNLRLIAQLRRALWAKIQRQEARPETAIPRDLPAALPSKRR